MNITLKLFATLQDYLPPEGRKTNAIAIDVAPTTTVMDIVERHKLPLHLCHLVLIDGKFVPPEERAVRCFMEGETLAIWPPVAGG